MASGDSEGIRVSLDSLVELSFAFHSIIEYCRWQNFLETTKSRRPLCLLPWLLAWREPLPILPCPHQHWHCPRKSLEWGYLLCMWMITLWCQLYPDLQHKRHLNTLDGQVICNWQNLSCFEKTHGGQYLLVYVQYNLFFLTTNVLKASSLPVQTNLFPTTSEASVCTLTLNTQTNSQRHARAMCTIYNV